MIKNIILQIVPDELILYIKKLIIRTRKRIEFRKLIKFDTVRFNKYAYEMNSDFSYTNLRSKITFHYHSIEKGLSNANFRPGFGEKAFDQLFIAMKIYVEKGFPVSDSRFQQALSVIRSYLILHDNINIDVSTIEKQYDLYSKFLEKENISIGGSIEINRDELVDYSNLKFTDLAQNRISVRDFSSENIKNLDVFDAIQVAMKSPSVCNRQLIKVHYLDSNELVKSALEIQGGLRGNGENLSKLILVTADKGYMNGPHERNQTYVDGGIFFMSLLYALTEKNIATCALNADFSLDKEIRIRKLLNLKDSEDLIAFIALGSYPDIVKYTKSPRDSMEQILEIHT